MKTTHLPKILLVGTGNMAREYAKVLKALKKNFLTVGRGEENALIFEKVTGRKAVTGGLEKWLKVIKNKIPPIAIIATNEEQLGSTARLIAQRGARLILIEKPGGMNLGDIVKTQKTAMKTGAKVFIAYNRRFYASVQKTQKLIREDGKVLSFNFEFTEWSHKITRNKKPMAVKKIWLLANSSHVIDLAFFLGGKPETIKCFTSGGLDWHPNASMYTGAGVSQTGALFSYHANWESAGRWGVEILTPKRKLILRPLEKLSVQNRDSLIVEDVFLNDKLDIDFKPGLYLQVKSFLNSKADLPTIQEQIENVKYYNLIEGK
jgi:predicted dehydrogenase